MVNIKDSINESILTDKNVLGLKSVNDAFLDNNFAFVSTQCIADALDIYFTCSKSKFHHQHF